MMFNHASASRLYFGSDQGLMYVDFSAKSLSATLVSTSSTPCNVALCGTVLTISNDGNLVVVSDTVSTPGQVYIYNGGSTTTAPVDLVLSHTGETAAAAFSPDQLKLFILTNLGNMYVYSTVDALTSVPVATTATDVKFSADGSFAYVAGTPAPGTSISGFATCNPQLPQGNLGSVTTPGIPVQIFPSPDAQHVIAIDPPNIDIFTVADEQIPLPYDQFVCNAPTVDFGAATSYNLGQGNFTPVYTQLVADGTELIVIAQNVPAVLLFNVSDGTHHLRPALGITLNWLPAMCRQQHAACRLRLHRRKPGLRRCLRSVCQGRNNLRRRLRAHRHRQSRRFPASPLCQRQRQQQPEHVQQPGRLRTTLSPQPHRHPATVIVRADSVLLYPACVVTGLCRACPERSRRVQAERTGVEQLGKIARGYSNAGFAIAIYANRNYTNP